MNFNASLNRLLNEATRAVEKGNKTRATALMRQIKRSLLNRLLNEAALAVENANRTRAVRFMHELERFYPNWRNGPRNNLWYVLHNINTWPTPPSSPRRNNSPRRVAAARKIQRAYRRYKK